jgi:EAL domain-containing protein (putative c-di-GMP-specific phosphodiesterase class I)
VRLCEDLGAEVVAEGIETPTEFRALRETGIHLAQGYLFARPAFPLPQIDPAALNL